MSRAQPLIVGAGPAGVRAAETLAKAGLRPLVVDEAPACGGQIYRQPLVKDGRDAHDLYGSEAEKAERLHRAFAALSGRIDHLPRALVWNLRDGRADIAVDGVNRTVNYDGLILATGASDRVLPVPGWTLPGVFTLGGSQVALKGQGCAIGRRVVFAGTGPLLYLVAWQYMKAGVRVVAVLDAAPLSAKRNLLGGLALYPAIILRGARFAAELKLRGVMLRHGISDLSFEGKDRVVGVRWREKGRENYLSCDAVGYGLNLRPETQLADLAGCAFIFNERDRVFVPQREPSGRTSVRGVYVAGDGAGIAGADAAELAGERAALALLEDRGLQHAAGRAAELELELARISRFRDVMEAAFPVPAHWAATVADDTVVCRCEEVTAGTLRSCVRDFALDEINRLKAVSRVGMGRCQGRFCGASAAEILAAETGRSVAAVGRLRGQPPVKPVPLTLIPREAAE